MKTMKMRKTLVAASLLVAACGSTEVMDDPGAPTSCTTAADCESGYACETSTHECVAGALTIDPTDEVAVDGTRWWTAVSDPVVKGTFDGPASTTFEVEVGAASVAATVQGNTWSVKLPASSIATTETWVTVTMADGSGATFEATQLFQLDEAAPQIGLAISKVRDERGDTIDFSAGEPVHTHAGAEIDLAAQSCPAVYKYVYLMGAQDPTFGRQTTQNPLAWSFEIRDAKITTSSYRVRNASNQVMLDWQPLPIANGVARIELRTSDLAALTSYAGQLSVDVLARDWTGRESTSTACIDYHPLAAPLQVESIAPASAAFGGTPSLFVMSTAADSQLSLLAGAGLGPAVASQRIVQYTAEPIVPSYELTAAAMRFARTYVDDFVAVSTTALSNTACDQIDCSSGAPADPADSVTSGLLSQYRWTLVLIDEATNQPLSSGNPVIPPRGANEPPRAYRLVAHLGQLADLRATAAQLPAEYTLAGLHYTGYAPFDQQTRCTATMTRCRFDVCVELCTEATTYKRMVALDRAALEIEGLTITLKSSPSTSLEPTPIWNAAPSTAGAMTWDSGDDDLPGVH